jgi:hypothetical protein
MKRVLARRIEYRRSAIHGTCKNFFEYKIIKLPNGIFQSGSFYIGHID